MLDVAYLIQAGQSGGAGTRFWGRAKGELALCQTNTGNLTRLHGTFIIPLDFVKESYSREGAPSIMALWEIKCFPDGAG